MSSPSLLSTRRNDAICERFEAAWRSGQRPAIEAVLVDAEPGERSQLLGELVALEFELRLTEGQPAQVEDYLSRFPGDKDTVLAALAPLTDTDATDRGQASEAQHEAWPSAERYLLGEPIGRGGMGVVVSARDRQLNRELAVKILAEPLQTRREARERFLREARIVARLQHPGIIPIHEMGWLDERPYFSMKLVRGQSLAELLDARPHPDDELPRWLEIFHHVCETIAYAHAQGIVHRDLKPANVMLGSFGEVYVIDWGLAKQVPVAGRLAAPGDVRDAAGRGDAQFIAPDENSADTRAGGGDSDRVKRSANWTFLGDVLGTPQYMSPEQARGDIEAIDQRSDVFALGAVLCEILTGAPPYRGGDGMTQLEQAQQGDLTEALTRLEACPADRELVDLARHCLATEPAERPPDADHVSQRLTAFLRSVQDKLHKMELERAEMQTRTEERRRRRRVIRVLAGSLCLVALSLAAGAIWVARTESARRLEQIRQREHVHRDLAQTLDQVSKLYAGAPEDWREDPSRWTRIRELAHRAEALAESPWAEPAHVRRVRDLRGRIEAEDADGRLLDRLEAIRLKCAEANPRTNKFASGRTRPMYRYAFDDYGLNLEKVDAQQATARIRSRPPHVVEACVFGLESWRSLFKQPVPQRQWIDAVLDGIDDNPWRRAVRQACRQQNWSAVDDLLETAKDEPLSADAVNIVASSLVNANQLELALKLLRAAQPRHPGDFWINQYLGLIYYCLPHPQHEEAVRFFTAALAIRETSAAYFNLATALTELKRYPEAEQAFRSALRLQPDYVQAHLDLAGVLERRGQTAEAAALRVRAAQLQQAKKPTAGEMQL